MSTGPILYLTGTYPCWSESFVAQELPLLRAAGLPLLPVAIRRGLGEPQPGWEDIQYLDDRPAQPAPATKAVNPILPGDLHAWLTLRRHREALRRLCELATENRVDHLHSAFADLPGLLTARAAELLDASYSLSVHANDALTCKYGWQTVYGKSKVVLACNQFIAKTLRRRPVYLKHRLQVIPHGLLLEQWPARVTPWEPGASWRLLFVGRLVPKKAPERLLSVLRAVLAAGQAATLTIVGDGPALPDLRQAAQGLPVHFTGVLPRRELPGLMQNHDLLLMVSRATYMDAEGVPNVIVEAMASGLPVCAIPTGGIGEVLTEATGFPMAEPETALPLLLGSLRATPTPAQARIAAARQLVEQGWDARPLAAARAKALAACLPQG